MLDSPAFPEAVVENDWVMAHMNDPSVIVAEVNTDLQTGYNQGHIPGAVGWSLHTDLEDQVRRDIPSLSQLEDLLGRSGIDRDTTIVLYGDGNNRSATWAFWVLKYYRHKDARLINGGRQKWVSEGRPLSVDIVRPARKTYKADVPDRTVRAMKEYIAGNLSKPSVKLLDTRTYDEYAGTLSASSGTPGAGVDRNGRIPGAVHIPWDDGAAENGAFRPVEELRRMYREKGITPDHEVIAYCRLGVRASYSWFVLKYLLGYDRVRNYDGSWTEWGNSVGVPIEIE